MMHLWTGDRALVSEKLDDGWRHWGMYKPDQQNVEWAENFPWQWVD